MTFLVFVLAVGFICLALWTVNLDVRFTKNEMHYFREIHSRILCLEDTVRKQQDTIKQLTYEIHSDYNNVLELWERVDNFTGTDRYGKPSK